MWPSLAQQQAQHTSLHDFYLSLLRNINDIPEAQKVQITEEWCVQCTVIRIKHYGRMSHQPAGRNRSKRPKHRCFRTRIDPGHAKWFHCRKSGLPSRTGCKPLCTKSRPGSYEQSSRFSSLATKDELRLSPVIPRFLPPKAISRNHLDHQEYLPLAGKISFRVFGTTAGISPAKILPTGGMSVFWRHGLRAILRQVFRS